ncbi:unnamed protein product [[Candida] boidinii]|uniref:Unnamed protein product n=1 Tax=Candida boidinii TaxID=5477 RepID=A0ACB5TEZ1_CANBO|nr:unnamed protein product [[Candida] boidinii]
MFKFNKFNKNLLNFNSIIIKKNYYSSIAKFPETGQPIHETRPHLIKSGDLTIGISAIEYYQRRYELTKNLPSSSIAIIPGNSTNFASGSVFYYFQQNNDLYYLTGWNEPDSVCILEKPNDNPDSAIFHMIVPEKDKDAEMWEGFRTGVDGVKDIFNADNSIGLKEMNPFISKLLNNYKNVFYDFNDNSTFNKNIFNSFFNKKNLTNFKNKLSIENLLKEKNSTIKPLKNLITNLRSIKSNSELKLMRLAGKISGRSYNQAYAKRFKSEKTLAAYLEYRFINNGCERNAYIPVVAGGDNSLCIHYTRNDRLFKGDELVLVDAAGSLGGYCSDISRTWPVNGKFTEPQKELYQAVLNVEKECIKNCTANNNISLQDLHYQSVSLMTKELRNCGFVNLQDWETSKYLYPHYIGHNLGLDVHDIPSYPRNSKFKKGQVVTVEPGVYVPNTDRWPKHFRNIGIRIEDDIAIGQDNYVILTVEAAKEISDIEAISEYGVTTPMDDEVTDIYSL